MPVIVKGFISKHKKVSYLCSSKTKKFRRIWFCHWCRQLCNKFLKIGWESAQFQRERAQIIHWNLPAYETLIRHSKHSSPPRERNRNNVPLDIVGCRQKRKRENRQASNYVTKQINNNDRNCTQTFINLFTTSWLLAISTLGKLVVGALQVLFIGVFWHETFQLFGFGQLQFEYPS